MPVYRFKAVTPDGKRKIGTIEAYDEHRAVQEIRKSHGIIEYIECVPQKKEIKNVLNEPISISNKALALLARQFFILTRAGLPMPDVLKQCALQNTDKYLKEVLTKTGEDVNAGHGLAESLEKNCRKMPLFFVETIRAGEKSGTLTKSFDMLSKNYEKMNKIGAKVKSALLYPLFLMVLAVVVVTVVIKVALPTISDVISSSGGDIPALTRILLSVSSFFSKYWLIVLLIISALLIFILYFRTTAKGKQLFSKLELKMPMFGKLNILKISAMFSNMMATLLDSGQNIIDAMEICSKVVNNTEITEGLLLSKKAISEGTDIGTAISENVPVFRGIMINLITAGDKSGKLPETLETLGEYYGAEAEETSNKILTSLEPVLTLVLGLVIGTVVIALYLPMFSMYSGM